jgi:hypothetical protein
LRGIWEWERKDLVFPTFLNKKQKEVFQIKRTCHVTHPSEGKGLGVLQVRYEVIWILNMIPENKEIWRGDLSSLSTLKPARSNYPDCLFPSTLFAHIGFNAMWFFAGMVGTS